MAKDINLLLRRGWGVDILKEMKSGKGREAHPVQASPSRDAHTGPRVLVSLLPPPS